MKFSSIGVQVGVFEIKEKGTQTGRGGRVVKAAAS